MKYLAVILLSVFSICSYAFPRESVRFHCGEDTVKINGLLEEAIRNTGLKSSGDYMSFFADKLLGTPYVAHTLEGDKEYFTINVHQLDCTTFVETLLALTKTSMAKATDWTAFAEKLETIRYRSGKAGGYPSRLHYTSAWIVENTARGNVSEITSRFQSAENIVKTLNFMSRNKDNYPALADSANYEAIKKFEAGYNMHMYPIINKRDLRKKEIAEGLKDGDILCLTTKIDGLDISHLGIVRFVKGKPHLLHASFNDKKVTIDKNDLFETLRARRNNTGIRVLRVSENIY